MCGEHFIISARGLGKTGSSPHVRGALSQLQCPCRWLGIIPACAGSTRTLRGFRTGRWDHPRMCGEHYVHRPQLDWDVGSSPHVRGAQPGELLRPKSQGIIPACAGSTAGLRRCLAGVRDHPRMCGEHNGWKDKAALYLGSSPHVRGARAGRLCGVPRSGIIPACSGSTPSNTTPRATTRDHPRMCGEHTDVRAVEAAHQGSSPHVRGALHDHRISILFLGIIPACAGSTPTATRPSREPRDHPRMCGEHLPDVSLAVPLPGSSPHVRGARPCLPLVAEPCGIIPACAGSTAPHGRTARPKRDHPRMCGEHSFVANP